MNTPEDGFLEAGRFPRKRGGSSAFSDLLEKKRHPGIFSSEEALKSLLIFSNFEHKMDTNRWYFLSMNDTGRY